MFHGDIFKVNELMVNECIVRLIVVNLFLSTPILYRVTKICSEITRGRVLNGELYTQRF